jgi:hypothetical protein
LERPALTAAAADIVGKGDEHRARRIDVDHPRQRA